MKGQESQRPQVAHVLSTAASMGTTKKPSVRHRSLDEDEIIFALEMVMPTMTEVSINLISERLAEFFGVAAASIKERHRLFLLDQLPRMSHLLATFSERSSDEEIYSTESDGHVDMTKRAAQQRSRVCTKAKRVKQSKQSRPLAPNKRKKQDMECDGVGKKNKCFPRKPTRNQSANPSKRIAGRRLEDFTKDDAIKQSTSTKKKAAATSPRALKNLSEMAKVAGLLSSRSNLSRELKQIDTVKHKTAVLQEALRNAKCYFTGEYPTKPEILQLKAAKDRARELEDINVANIVTHSHRSAARKLDFLGALARDAHRHLESDEEEKDDDSDVSEPSDAQLMGEM